MDWPYEQRVFRDIRQGNNEFLSKVRMVDKHGEIRPNTTKGISLPRLALELREFNSNVGGGEGTQFETVSGAVESICKERKDCSHQDVSISNRQTFSNATTISGGKSLPIGDEPVEDTGCEGEVMEWSNSVNRSDIERPKLVEGQIKEKSANVTDVAPARSRSVDGCLPRGMGSPYVLENSRWSGSGVDGSWLLDQRLDFQSKRIGRSEGSDSTFSEVGTDEGCSTLANPHRQLHDSLQYQQKSFVPQFDTTDERPVQLSIPMVNDSKSSSCERFGKRESGQFIENEQVWGLYDRSGGTSTGFTGIRCSDIPGSVCVEDEPSARSVLHIVKHGQEEFNKGCIQHNLVGEGDSVNTPPSTTSPKMFAKGKEGEGESGIDRTVLVRTGMDTNVEVDDSEDDSDGRVEVIITPRKINDKASGQVASGLNSSVFSERRNDEGQQMVLMFLRARGLSEFSDWFFRSVAESTWRNYRRGFTLFSVILRKCGVDPLSINTVDRAVAALIRALKVASELKTRLSTIFLMKTAVLRLFSFVFNVDLSHMPMVKMALRCLTLNEMPRKEMLRLQWSVDQLLNYLMRLPSFETMEFNQLTAVTVVLCMAFTALRFSEIYSLDIQETLPDRGKKEWRFWVHIKNHDFKEPVVLHGVDDSHLDPLSALWTLRSAVYNALALKREKPVGFWYRMVEKECIPLGYDGMRTAAVRILQQAGIEENRPYHIKHAVLTCLHESGTSAKDIAAFARHRFDSMAAYHHYISYDGGKMSVQNIVSSIKRGV
jgi:integrase